LFDIFKLTSYRTFLVRLLFIITTAPCV